MLADKLNCEDTQSMKPVRAPSNPLNLTRRFAVASFGVIGVIALGLAWMMSNMLTNRLLEREGSVTQEFIQNLLGTDNSAEFFVDPTNPEFAQRFLKSMAHIETMKEPVRVNAYRPDGTVIWSTDKTLINRRFIDNAELQEAMRGQLVVHSGNARGGIPDKEEHEGLALHGDYYVESYIPIYQSQGASVVGAMEFYKIPTQLNQSIREGVMRLWLACLASAVGLFVSLYWIVSRADQVLRQQQIMLTEAQALSTAVELTSAVAHNLRNPLASIRVSAEMLQQADMQLPDTTEHSHDIMQAVDRADRWISELVRASQASNLVSEPVPVAALMRDCVQEMQLEFKRNRIEIAMQDWPDLQVIAHRAMLRQIVLSIIANALDAMTHGGQLTLRWQQLQGQAELTLSDTGTGISQDVRHSIFRPFFSTKGGGLGIGLALVKRVVTQWQGTIELLPVLPHGTSVVIRLPLVK
jgi:two-component system, NtrC family, sensor histidine kinase HydH